MRITGIAIRIAIVATIGGIVWLVREQVAGDISRDQQISQRITLLDTPVITPKEEPKPIETKEELAPEFQPAPQETAALPEPGALGLDAAAFGGPDAFSLVGRPGGRDILRGVQGNGEGGAQGWGWYGSVVQQYVETVARQDKRLQGYPFVATVRLWIGADGRLVRVVLVDSTGSRDMDRALSDSLAHAPPLSQPPPRDMPQPIFLRVKAHVPG